MRLAPQTREGTILGTAPYMSPEQIEGKGASVRSDVFSLGIIFYEMAMGARPFSGDSAMGLFSVILKDAPAPIDRFAEPVRLVIERCLEKDPADRFASAGEVHAELARLKKGTREAIARSEREIPWIAVLPFRNRSSDPALESFGDDLADDLITGLSRFPHYFVVAASSAFRFKGHVEDVRGVAKELGARYVLEGSVRAAGETIRVNAQLSDADTGTGLWAETFQRELGSGDIFTLQDELTDRIVATVADVHGMLASSIGARVKSKPVDSLSPYEAVLQYFAYFRDVTPSEHLRTRAALERAVEIEPHYASAWACLSVIYVDEYRFDFNTGEDPLARALRAARKAVELDATSPLAYLALAVTTYFRRDFAAFHAAAERAMALNPRDANSAAQLGILLAYTGEWETSLDITRRSMELNPHHPGWYYFGHFYNHYRKGEYGQAFETAQKINMPGHAFFHSCLAIAAGQLGYEKEAMEAVRELLEVFPHYAEEARAVFTKWNFPAELIDAIIDGLRKAGLEGAH